MFKKFHGGNPILQVRPILICFNMFPLVVVVVSVGGGGCFRCWWWFAVIVVVVVVSVGG